MLPSETKEGKVEAKIQDELDKVILQKAVSERIFRYRKGGTKRVNWDRIDKVTDVLDIFDAEVLIAGIELGGILTAIGKSIKRKVEVTSETYICRLDGRVNYSATRAREISLLRNNLVEEMRKKYKKKLHYLISIKYYHELVAEPRSDDLLKEVEHKKTIISLCKLVDDRINAFCKKMVNLSVVTFDRKEIKNKYNILLTTRERIDSPQDTYQLNKYSLFLSYRTGINQI